MRQAFAIAARFHRCESGASAVEYGVILAFIALVVSVGALATGNGLNGLFDFVATKAGAVLNPPA